MRDDVVKFIVSVVVRMRFFTIKVIYGDIKKTPVLLLTLLQHIKNQKTQIVKQKWTSMNRNKYLILYQKPHECLVFQGTQLENT